MMVNLCLLGVFTIAKQTTLQIVFTNTFVILFNATFGPTLWVYASEVVPSAGMSMIAFCNMVFTSMFATFTNILFKVMTAEGFYFTLAGIQVICLIFVWVLVIETKGKTKKEIEMMYSSDVIKSRYSSGGKETASLLGRTKD